MKFALALVLSLLLVQSFSAAAVARKQAQQNNTEALQLLENGYVRIWADLMKPEFKAEMKCELAKRDTWSHGVEEYLEEFKTDLEAEIAETMQELLTESCSGFRSLMEKELSEMIKS